MTDRIEMFSEIAETSEYKIIYRIKSITSEASSTKNIICEGHLEVGDSRNHFSASFVIDKHSSYIKNHTCFYVSRVSGLGIQMYHCSCGRPYYREKDISPESCLARSNRYVREKIGDLCD